MPCRRGQREGAVVGEGRDDNGNARREGELGLGDCRRERLAREGGGGRAAQRKVATAIRTLSASASERGRRSGEDSRTGLKGEGRAMAEREGARNVAAVAAAGEKAEKETRDADASWGKKREENNIFDGGEGLHERMVPFARRNERTARKGGWQRSNKRQPPLKDDDDDRARER